MKYDKSKIGKKCIPKLYMYKGNSFRIGTATNAAKI